MINVVISPTNRTELQVVFTLLESLGENTACTDCDWWDYQNWVVVNYKGTWMSGSRSDRDPFAMSAADFIKQYGRSNPFRKTVGGC